MRPSRFDRALLAVLVPLWGACFALSLRSLLADTATPGVYVYRAESPNVAPIVEGIPPPVRGQTALRAGDRLLRVGDTDLRGTGPIELRSIVAREAAGGRRPEAVFDRGGAVERTALPIFPFTRANAPARVSSLVFLASAILLLLRSRGSRLARSFGYAFLACAFTFNANFVGSPAVVWLSLAVAAPAYTLTFPLALRAALRFPRGLPHESRWRRGAPWLFAIHAPLAITRTFGVPLWAVPAGGLAFVVEVAFFATLLGVLTHSYRREDPIGRRQLRWILVAAWWACAPPVVFVFFPLLAQDLTWLFFASISALALLPVGIVFAIARYNLFDVDRLISRTASYSAALVVSLAAIVLLVPPAAAAIATATGSSEATIRIVLSIGMVLLFVVLEGRLRPIIDHWLYPERSASERGVQQLLQDLPQCRLPEEITKLVSERLVAILRLTGGRVWTRDQRGWTCDDRGETRLADGALADLLEHDPVPLARDPSGRMARAPQLGQREALAALEAEVAVPLRCGKDLVAIVALGPKRSADIYTPAEMAHLAAVAAKASEELLRLHDTEIIRLERSRTDEQRALKDAAELADQAKSRFLAAASHDLRQPLHALGLFAGRLVERVEGGSLGELAAKIQSSTATLTEMLDAILDLSRLDTGAVTPNLQTFEVDPLLARLLGELEETAREKGLALRGVPTRAVVRSDPILLGRILRNLLTNAVRYTEQGSIVVAGEPEGETIAIGVSDTGAGIPAAKQQEIFREFVQLDAGRSAGGLGLGLSIVDRLCRLLGHPLSVASVPGQGSVFTVSLPLGARTLVQPTPLIDAASLTGRLVVVIDEDLTILGGTRDTLEAWGCDVIAAANVEEAIESLDLHQRCPDAIVSDYRLLSGRTGIEAIREIRERLGAPVPALVVSGEADPERQAAIRSAGFPLLPKPLPPSKLRAALLELLRQ